MGSLQKYILVINPGSTSTKIALFNTRGTNIVDKTLRHDRSELETFDKIYDQKDMRIKVILEWLKEIGITLGELKAIVARGGLLRPMPGGTYHITNRLIEDLKNGYQGQHASNLGGIVAKEIAKKVDINAYIVDPVAVDELSDIARLSGLPEVPRTSLVHALNVRAVARRICNKLNKNFEESSYVVAHIGGGISVVALENGKMIDVSNGYEGGPMSPERCGELPSDRLVDMCFSGKCDKNSLIKDIQRNSGILGYIGLNDGRAIEEKIVNGDREAELIFNAMAYQIAKEIAAMATVLKGKVDAIILTGGLVYSERLVNYIKEKINFIAPIELVPGEDEMLALYEGAARVLSGEEDAKIYEEEVGF
ncbi:butyrate kinase [Clostridium collagenovorans DSM 3089]|uniref:Probable butyrate kinase n=1 Tax=Clostridium collagenovorans DSM 3089 TaxID=1121306 RepID=A0A1M5WT09_9CLOT|nr:butyrate kinase [Clostridium collagenovorans DSM 3089]